jgi:hypothetical protein
MIADPERKQNLLRANFSNFLYLLKSEKELLPEGGATVLKDEFFDDYYLEKQFKFYQLLQSDKPIVQVTDYIRGSGVTTHFVIDAFYKCFAAANFNSLFITDRDTMKYITSATTELARMLEPLTTLTATKSKTNGNIRFSNNNEILFQFDTTFELSEDDTYSQIIFDGAQVKNADKLQRILQTIIKYNVTSRVILNFDSVASGEGDKFKENMTVLESYIKTVNLRNII